MKIKKTLIAISILIIMVLNVLVYSTNASVIYKDISTISIRTNFQFDYEILRDEGLPEITYNSDGNDSDTVYVYPNAKYEIESCEWYSQGEKEFEIGGSPKVVVYLVTKEYTNGNPNSNNDYYYRFLSSYSSSTCYISKGNYVSATRLSYSTLKVVFSLQGIKGTFNPPENAYWEDGRAIARWDSPNVCDSGFYDIVLYRNTAVVARVDKYRGNSYDFSAYFNREGDYAFKVRTVAGTEAQSAYGKSSEYIDSGGMYVDESTLAAIASSGGAGSANSNAVNAGWVQRNNVWYFYKPDGEIVRNGWVQWQNKWYYLDEKGEMKVGLQNINNRTYYLGTDGTMVTGWVNINETYYYFSDNSNDDYGAMIVLSWIKYENKYFYFDENGVMVTGWKQIADNNGNIAYYYFYPKGTTQGLYGYMATNTSINGFSIGSDGRWIQN